MSDKIELLPISILEQHREMATNLKRLNFNLAIASGWHYLLDWIWIIEQLGDVSQATILDAGAGIGLLQWYLAIEGARVISVDRSDRSILPTPLIKRFNVTGFRVEDTPRGCLESIHSRPDFSNSVKAAGRGLLMKLRSGLQDGGRASGSVAMYRGDLINLPQISNDSVDAVISISAIEHNSYKDDIRRIRIELERVLKPGGMMLITLPAARDEDWFMEAANAWCLTDRTIRWVFDLEDRVPSNFSAYDEIYRGIVNSLELSRSVSWRYRCRSNSGLPRAKWPPKYVPVAILKTKQA